MPEVTFFEAASGELVATEQKTEPEPPRRRKQSTCRLCKQVGHNALACEQRAQHLRPERAGGKWCRWCSGLSARRPAAGCPGCGLPYEAERIAVEVPDLKSSAGALLEE